MESLPIPHHTEKKQSHFSLSASPKAICVKLQNVQVSIMHHAWLPYLPTRKSSTVPGQTEYHPQAKLKNLNSGLQSNTDSGSGVGMLNLPRRTGVEQGANLSAPNSQWSNMCAHKAAKAEIGSRVTSQPPRGAAHTQPPGPSRDQKRHKDWEQEWGWHANLPSQGRRWIPELISGTELRI
jgi:hypothetical protein